MLSNQEESIMSPQITFEMHLNTGEIKTIELEYEAWELWGSCKDAWIILSSATGFEHRLNWCDMYASKNYKA